MKKIISILLTVVMLAGLFTVNVSATTLDEVKQESLELYLFEDIFMGMDEFLGLNDFSVDLSTNAVGTDSIYLYKGLTLDSKVLKEISYPQATTRKGATVAMIIESDSKPARAELTIASQIASSKLIKSDDGRYDFRVAGTVYHLGEIAAGKKTGNVFFPGQVYDVSSSTNEVIKNEVLNSAYIQEESTKAVTSATYPINKTGLESINILSSSFANLMIGSNSSYKANETRGELMPVTVTYSDGTTEEYYIVNGSVYLDFPYAIRVADKGKALAVNSNQLQYKDESTAVPVGTSENMNVDILGKIFDVNGNKLLMPKGSEILASINRLSQNFGTYTSGLGYTYSYEIPVDTDKTVNSLTVGNPVSLGAGDMQALMGTDNVVQTSLSSYIKFASDDNKDYYVAIYSYDADRNYSGLFGVTLKHASYQKKIDEVNTLIDALEESTVTPAQILEIESKIEKLKAENGDVNDTHFNIGKINQLKEYLKSQVTTKIDEFKVNVDGLGEKYTLSIKDKVKGVKAEYDFLIANDIEDEDIGLETVNKFKSIYKQYEDAEAFEENVGKWALYTYTIYEDVKDAKEKIDDLDGAITEETVEKVEEYYEIAVLAKAIDEKIKGFGEEYNSSMLEDLLETEKEIEEFYKVGTKEALEYIETFEELLKKAENDVLNNDIKNVEERVNALPDAYTTSIKEEIGKILEAIASIEGRDGQISAETKTKINILVSQMNEEPMYIAMKLDYTRDVFENMTKYGEQALVNDDNTYTYPTGSWGLVVSAISSTTKRAFAEEEFITKLGINSENKATINGIPYQFGVVHSAVNGAENEANSIYSGDLNGEIEIDVQDAPYSELYMAAWSGLTNNVPVTITYHYSDGTTSTDANVTKIKGGTTLPKLDEFTKALYEGTIRMWRASSGTDKWGAYNGVVISHILTPDDTKMLDSITITTSGKEINIFALTGITSNSGIMAVSLKDTMAKLEETDSPAQIRELLVVAETLIGLIEAKEVDYNPQYKATIATLKEKYIEVEDVVCYTDIDNRNITVTFTGEIAEEYFTKDYFGLIKDGKIFTDYTVEKVSGKEVLIKFANKFDYDCKYTVEISKDIMNKEKSVALEVVCNKEYDGLKAVEADIIYADGKAQVYVKNNTKDKQSVTVMICVYDEFNSLVNFELLEKELVSDDVMSENITFDAKDGKIQCIVTDNIDKAKLLYNEINLQ